jgi:hypothetical protein
MLKKLFFVLVVLSFSALGFAQDDQGNPNEPTINDHANACYEGGSMAGRCTTAWDWEAGWYLIRFEYGMISREDFPAQYAIVLEPLPEQSRGNRPVGCLLVYSDYGIYIDFGSGNFVPVGSPAYSDPKCKNNDTFGYFSNDYVFTTLGLSDAVNLCEPHGYTRAFTTSHPNVYFCQP